MNRIFVIGICIAAGITGSYMLYNAIAQYQYAEEQVNIDQQRLEEIKDNSDINYRHDQVKQCMESIRNGTEPLGFKELDYCDKKIG